MICSIFLSFCFSFSVSFLCICFALAGSLCICFSFTSASSFVCSADFCRFTFTGCASHSLASFSPPASCSSAAVSSSLYRCTSSTRMVPSVIVPVLSRQRVSTLASVSIQYNSCTSVFFVARTREPSVRATLVSSTRPSGIIPRTAATIFTTESFRLSPTI